LRSQVENRDFFELLDERLEGIRNLHKRTRDYIGNLYASTNPLAFTQGGFYGGNLKPTQKLKESKDLMESTTYSFGITALDELQRAHNGKSLVEDNEFAFGVLKYIEQKANEFKKEDHMLYALYGTPAESLCGKQIKQLRQYVGENVPALVNAGYEVEQVGEEYVIPNVCDRKYVSNSFHCNVREDISPILKQNLEYEGFHHCNGGHIQYVKYNLGYNKQAMETLIERAMELGFYEGCNMSLSYCDDCGHEELDLDDACPICGSKNLTKVDRMNGYLAFSRVKGDTRLNEAKMAEIADRVSM
jgi:ribonucleoside-triphosphate reductase